MGRDRLVIVILVELGQKRKGTAYCRPDKVALNPLEQALTKHLENGHPKALGVRKGIARTWLSVLPVGSSAGVEQDGDEEEIEKALFRGEARCGGDLRQGGAIDRGEGSMGRMRTSMQGRDDDGRRVGKQVPV